MDPTVALCLGTYDDAKEVGVSYEHGTPAGPMKVDIRLLGKGNSNSRGARPVY